MRHSRSNDINDVSEVSHKKMNSRPPFGHTGCRTETGSIKPRMRRNQLQATEASDEDHMFSYALQLPTDRRAMDAHHCRSAAAAAAPAASAAPASDAAALLIH